MDLLEKINRSLGHWYDNLFGGGDVRPKDILRRILAAMEDYREEGLDGRLYVPNQIILEIDARDEEEKEYLLAFLDRDELENAIQQYCQQNQYQIRGTLDFTIREAPPPAEDEPRGERVRLYCRYAKARAVAKAESETPLRALFPSEIPLEERTVASPYLSGEESGTVPSPSSAVLHVQPPDRAPFLYQIARGSVTIGRSHKLPNDLVVESDGQMSKRHARIELDADGRFTIYDLDSTNGVQINGRRMDNSTLQDGDEIVLGATRLRFQQNTLASEPDSYPGVASPSRAEPEPIPGGSHGAFGSEAIRQAQSSGSRATPPVRPLRARNARLVLIEQGQETEDYLLASETTIGRGVTNDIVLTDRSVAMRHARILFDGKRYALETLDGTAETRLNGEPVAAYQPMPLQSGDRIELGCRALRFDTGE